jgi:lysophospholipase L1-like esterase
MTAALLGTAALSASSAGAATAHKAKAPLYYVALGDSYAMGYQPGYSDTSETVHGYVQQLPALVKAKANLVVENFGCGGATSTSVLTQLGCDPAATPLGGPTYPTQTQEQAAIAFINAHPGQIGLITISIGGNDFDNCVNSSDAIGCVGTAMPTMKANITTLAADLRAAAGASVPMIATTYPDVLLGLYVTTPPNVSFANLSLIAFKSIINPDLAAAYGPSNVSFIDVTTATGAFTPLTKTTKLAPYGKIPVAVANVCSLTWFCEKKDIHPKTAGYTVIAKLVAKQFLTMVK